MSEWDPKWKKDYDKEYHSIASERESCPGNSERPAIKFFDKLSFIFLISGFVALGLIFFTNITFVHATCLFIISHVLAPSSGDLYKQQVKGIAEDLAHTRINTTIIGKHIKNEEKT